MRSLPSTQLHNEMTNSLPVPTENLQAQYTVISTQYLLATGVEQNTVK